MTRCQTAILMSIFFSAINFDLEFNYTVRVLSNSSKFYTTSLFHMKIFYSIVFEKCNIKTFGVG